MNKVVVVLALIADVALCVNVWRHWDDGARVDVYCKPDKANTSCTIITDNVRREVRYINLSQD